VGSDEEGRDHSQLRLRTRRRARCAKANGSANAVVDRALTQTTSRVARILRSSWLRVPSRSGKGGDLGTLRAARPFVIVRTLCVAGRPESRSLSDAMGRAGIEPATLGLKVDADALASSRERSQRRMVERIADRTPSGGLTKTCRPGVDPICRQMRHLRRRASSRFEGTSGTLGPLEIGRPRTAPDPARTLSEPPDAAAATRLVHGRTRTVDPLLTIQVLRREARAREGLRGYESRANRANLTTTRDPRVDARDPADVRTPFARHSGCSGSDSRGRMRLSRSRRKSAAVSLSYAATSL